MNAKQFFEEVRATLYPIYEPSEADSIASLLLEYTHQLSRNQIIMNERQFMLSDKEKVQPLLKRLLKNEPVQYVLGETHFYGRDFIVNSDVLIPRPETEELVNLIIQQYQKSTNLTVLDIGTGSGCIPITLFHHLPQAEVHAIDISEKTLAVAQQNAKRLQANRIQFHQMNILNDGVSELPDFDVIVSNPPYVRATEKMQMQANVLNFEPELALFVPDDDPLIFYEKITELSSQKLKPHGQLYFEINEAFGEEMIKLLEKYNFKNIVLHQDMQNQDRMVCGIKMG